MWHEARKHEKKIRGMMVDYKRRAERRRDYYERIKQDPAQFLQVHGRPAKIHLDPAVAAAADSPATMMPWQGNPINMIDRFDVRAHLDIIPEYIQTASSASESQRSAEDEPDDRTVCYERYRTLVQNDYLNINEDKFLHQIFLEERFGPVLKPNFTEEDKKRLAEKKVAIAYVYEDSTPLPGNAEKGDESDPEEEEDEDDEDKDDLSDIDLDVTVNVTELSKDQCAEMNQHSLKYGMVDEDFITYLMQDKEEAEMLRLAKEIEEEKAMFSGRKSRRERRAIREKKLAGRKITSPPSYAARESPTCTPMRFSASKSRSRSKSPPNTGKIMFITSFGDEVSDGESKKSHSKDSKTGSDKKDSSNKKSESEVVIGPLLPDQYENKKPSKESTKFRKRRSSSVSSSATSKKDSEHSKTKTTKTYRSRHHSSSSRSRSRSKGRSSEKYRSDRVKSSHRHHSRSRSTEKSHSSRRRSGSSMRRSHRSRTRSRSRGRASRRSRSRSRSRIRSRSRGKRSHRSRTRTKSRDRSKDRNRSSHVSRSKTKSDMSRAQEKSSRRSDSSRSRSRSQSCPKVARSAEGNPRSRSRSKSVPSQLPPPPVKSYYRHSLSRSNSDMSIDEEDDDETGDGDRKDDSGSSLGFGATFRGQQQFGKGSTSTKALLTPQERLKKRMQLALNRQYKADKKKRMEKSEKQMQQQMDRAEELREMAIRLRQRERERRHRMRGYDDGSDSDSGQYRQPIKLQDEEALEPDPRWRHRSSSSSSDSSDGRISSRALSERPSHQYHGSSPSSTQRNIQPERSDNRLSSDGRGRSARSPPHASSQRSPTKRYRSRSPPRNGMPLEGRDDGYSRRPESSRISSSSTYRSRERSKSPSSKRYSSRSLVDY